MDRIAMLQELLAQNPIDAFARYGLGMALAAQGRLDEALGEYARILESSPDYVPAYQMSAQTLLKAGRPSEAQIRLFDGIAAAQRTRNAHAESEMQAMLDDLSL